MRKVVFITDLDLSREHGAGIWVYMHSLLPRLHVKALMAGKGRAKGMISLSPKVSNLRYHYYMRKNRGRILSQKDAILHAQRPDFLYHFMKGPQRKMVTLHGDPSSIIRRKYPLFGILYRFMERRAIAACERVIFIDNQTMTKYKRKYPGFAHRFKHIPSGVDSKVFTPSKKERKHFLYVGRLAPEKCVDKIITAYKRTDRPEPLIIIGEGPEKQRLMRLAGDDKRIRLIGGVKHSRLVTYYQEAKMLLLMSRTEGLPLVALEALSCGTPVAAPPVGDLTTLIRPGKNGAHIRAGLGKALSTQYLSKDCRDSVRDYSWDRIAAQLEEVYG